MKRLIAVLVPVLLALTGCGSGWQSVAVENLSDQAMTVELVRVGAGGIDRSWADLPVGAQTFSIRSTQGDDRLLLAEARLRTVPGSANDPCYVFELPTTGSSYYRAVVEDGRIVLRETTRFDAKIEVRPAR